ncbi:hypothetical protein C8R26_13140 [Nitrosomonas oligotropha]|uniref:Uncharacterized protein n=1 Tax=Nitrosomonas oligotropha TaxID=42354 RepID=A0A2T5HGZ5_9PROT|nr:hypothetical protein [Nitrosomonas oligotropha]PTQ70853.1 hypothetical protein C8R26_13140 [Nitrosomonas oligotropha]
MNVISLKTTASGTLYTCPAGHVAEVEMVTIASGTGELNMVSGGVSSIWVSGGASQLKSSITQGSGQASAAAENVFAEDTGGGSLVLRPARIRLCAGDSLSITTARNCSFIIYEETTGTH